MLGCMENMKCRETEMCAIQIIDINIATTSCHTIYTPKLITDDLQFRGLATSTTAHAVDCHNIFVFL